MSLYSQLDGFFLSLLKEQKVLLEDMAEDHAAKSYQRSDFLHIHTSSIMSDGNNGLYKRLKKRQEATDGTDDPTNDTLEDEDWDDWTSYPKEVEEWSLLGKEGSSLIAWVIYTFVCAVTLSKTKCTKLRTGDIADVFNTMGLDDLVFMFVQAQHNIGRWNLAWKAYKQGMVPLWKNKASIMDCECDLRKMKKMKPPCDEKSLELVAIINARGYEYPSGSGVGGKDGRNRYNALTKYFDDAYYGIDPDHNASVQENRRVLLEALEKLREDFEDDDSSGDDTGSNGGDGADEMPKLQKTAVDHINERGWATIFHEASIAV